MSSTLPPTDPPALRRLALLDAPGVVDPATDASAGRRAPTAVSDARRRHPTGRHRIDWRRAGAAPDRFGYQPGLDGLRAVSVIAVILYHAGFSWMRGGFFGVEVFFVVSGFLITSLLIDERGTSGFVALSQFWLRRARRLLPALAAVLVAVAAGAALVGSDEQLSQLRRDFPWALFYAGNWGQILGDVPYYAGDPPLLRHLWSLAIEEQFYLVWPLAFVALARSRLTAVRSAQLLGGLAVAAMVLTFWMHMGGPGPSSSPIGLVDGIDRVNLMYLSTFTRASGLLLGVAAAYVWRPWRTAARATPQQQERVRRILDPVGGVAVGALGCIAAVAVLTEGYVYQWLLPLVSVLSLVAVLVVVHPSASGMRSVFGWRPLVEIGKRSYGLYLWHWPIFVLTDATHASVSRVVLALMATVVLSELCYRFVETPVRRGALGRWWRTAGPARARPLAVAGAAAVALLGFYASVDRFDRAEGGDDATFSQPEVPTTVGAVAPVAPPIAAAPRRLTIVGDSQAHSLAINLPDGIEGTFSVEDGSLDGCSVYDEGRVRSSRTSFDNSFAMCEGWQQKWAGSVADSGSELALVVLGAWEVFDLETGDGDLLTFGTPAWDDYVTANLQEGVDALTGAGARVALLEVACMRPQSVQGAGVPPLPERADDAHVAHVNDVLRDAAAANPGSVTFVEGPNAWCADETVATDLAMRWDGVHVYKPGAALIYSTIAPALLAI